jgi:hypothetical protein
LSSPRKVDVRQFDPRAEAGCDFSTMHFVKCPHVRSTQIRPPRADHKPLIERLKHDWLFAVGLGMIALVALCGLWPR